MGIMIFLVAVATAAGPPQFQASTLSGQSASGAVVALTDQDVTLDAAGHRTTLKLSDVRLLGRVNPPVATAEPSQVWVGLTDGSRLSGSGYEVSKGTARLKLSDGPSIEIPTKWIARVEFPLPGAPPSAWPELPNDQSADLIVVKKKEGTDLVEGVAGDVSAAAVQFTVDGENIPVKLAKVAGLIYYHPAEAAALPTPACSVVGFGGWKIGAKDVALAGGQLKITTTFGAVIDRPLDAVRSLDYSAGHLVYLSDLPAASVDWTPPLDFGKANDALGRLYQPHFDKSLDGGLLRLAS